MIFRGIEDKFIDISIKVLKFTYCSENNGITLNQRKYEDENIFLK